MTESQHSQTHSTLTLRAGFLRSAGRFPDRPALEVGGAAYTYDELRHRALSIAATLRRHTSPGGVPLTAVFANRTVTAFAGILGALLRGHGYVPLNPAFPPERTSTMLRRSRCRSIVVGGESEAHLGHVLENHPEQLVLLLPDRENVGDLQEAWPQHTFVASGDFDAADSGPKGGAGGLAGIVDPSSTAYLMFTSGSTGTPKGVPVSHRNVVPFIETMADRYGITEVDRFSHTFDLTFDLSVFDMFVAWERGACLCCPSAKTLIKPGRFIKESGISVWFSVPSTGVFMRRLGMLKPGSYPSLRWSLFCGEPLPADVAQAWQEAAPNAILENLYGPTEVTIACTAYRWDPERSPKECHMGLVPIGFPFEGMTAIVVDTSMKEVSPGGEGELLMSGPQVTSGYLMDRANTEAAFIVPGGRESTFYRTGDRVRRPEGGGPLAYLSRLDHQIKIHGHRVELGEVEAVLREESKTDAAVAVGWPVTASGAGGIEAFLGGEGIAPQELRKKIAARLPSYMVPRRIHVLPSLPLNPNGKVDRAELLRRLETEG